jgi:hypothetical protein
MNQRWTALKARAWVLVWLLGCVGLLLPAPAGARPTPRPWRSAGSGYAGGDPKHPGPSGRVARGKNRHHKQTGASEARPKGKHRSAAAARARQAKVACTEAFGKAKEAAQESHLRAANEWFALCAEPSCARSLRRRCGVVHGRIAALLPSIVPVVTDASGAASTDAEVRMDGEILTSTLDGTAIVIDPGEHQFTFAKNGEVFATRKVSIDKGRQRQVVSAIYQPAKPEEVDPEPTRAAPKRPAHKAEPAVAAADSEPAPAAQDEEPDSAPGLVRREAARRAGAEAESKTGAPWSAYALAGVGLLGVGGYATFNLKGSADNDALVAFCKPTCKPESVRHVRNIYLAADVSLGIGIAALAASTYLFFRSNGTEEESPRARPSHLGRLGIEPTSAGALATVGGTF